MTDCAEVMVDAVEGVAGSALRDVWVFDQEIERCLYIREDVEAALEGHEPERYIDNERYGYITRQTYEELTYTSYRYTVRGFDEFETFRTFLRDGDGNRFGVLTSTDTDDAPDYETLYGALTAASGDVTFDAMADDDGLPTRSAATGD
jgi:hypothetical protein